MLKQKVVADTTANKMLVELSDAEQEASNGGLSMLPPSPPSLESITIPEVPSISIDIYGPPNASCPACSSGQNPNYTPYDGPMMQ
jgi:hypothetical protein